MTQLSRTEIKATKKTHRCVWCDGIIEIGESYIAFAQVDGRDFYYSKYHPECEDACLKQTRYWGYDFEFSLGMFKRGSIEEK